jgi:tryptophanyl-tRNA synthetase
VSPPSHSSWHHVKCFSLPRSWKKEGIEVFIRDAFHDPENLLDECRDEIMQAFLPQMSASAKKSKEKVAFDTSTILGKIKRNHMDMDSARSNCEDDEKVENASKKMRKLCEEELNEVKLYELYKNKNADELKDYMRYALRVWEFEIE